MKTDMDYIAEQCAEIDRRQGVEDTPPVFGRKLVATLRLPVAVNGLAGMTELLCKQYGEGLVMRQQGEFLFVEKPNSELTGNQKPGKESSNVQ